MAAEALENCSLFNAARRLVFTAPKEHEMEASIMCGTTGRAGSVAGLQLIKNPVKVARQVMGDGRYVVLSGARNFTLAQVNSRESPRVLLVQILLSAVPGRSKSRGADSRWRAEVGPRRNCK